MPHLYDLGLAHCVTDAEYLTELLLRHKDTLRRLPLSDIQLREGEWDSLFQNIGGKLPALRTVKLRGFLESEDWGCEYSFDIAASESRRISHRRDAVENYILTGGQWPNPRTLPQQTCYLWEQEGYEPPGLPESDDRTEDDPANKYSYDLVDARI